jgi:Carboxypeptidase regulatory-like domain
MRKIIILLVLMSLAVMMTDFVQAAQESHIAGVVTYANGRPAGSLWVIIYNRNEKQAGYYLTGDDGRYYIGYLAPGTYVLKVKRKESVLIQRSVSLPRDQNINIRLP